MSEEIRLISAVAKNIANYLLSNNSILFDEFDIYAYGFEILISSCISILTGLLISIAFSKIGEYIIFLIVFVTLRMFCGGFHADTYLKCNVIFVLNILCLMFIFEFIDYIPAFLCVVINSLCVITVVFLSPTEDINKPISRKQKRKLKLISSVICCFTYVVSTVLRFKSYNYFVAISTAMLSVTAAMIIKFIMEERENEKRH